MICNAMKRRTFLVGSCAGATSLLTNAGPLSQAAEASESANVPSLAVPPEEASHELTFMQWPVSRRVYPDAWFMKEVQQTIADIANSIAAFEPVVMLADESQHAGARRLLSQDVRLWDIATEDLWCRDSGPLIAKQTNGQRVVSHLAFNGWGGKQLHRNDGKLAGRVAQRLGMALVESGLKGEAGGADHDGYGLLMAHESSWVIGNRNPGLNRSEIEERLLKAYGAKRLIWAPGVKGLDITDYHIDSLARFTGPGRALINLPVDPDPSDPFHRASLETHDALQAAGINVDVIREPARPRVQSLDFVASYANFYVCNGAVMVAQFGDARSDRQAQAALKRHYPGREIIALNVDALGQIGGGIHCATQQLPAA